MIRRKIQKLRERGEKRKRKGGKDEELSGVRGEEEGG